VAGEAGASTVTDRDQGPQPGGNVREHLSELEAEGYHIAYCDHCREDASRRRAAWKTLDTSGFKVVLVACIPCYAAELRTAVRALAAVYVRASELERGLNQHRAGIVAALLHAMDGVIGGGDPYRDDSYPERICDGCQKPYRGPAIYCSLDCARRDA
jgi:hypothetical protein